MKNGRQLKNGELVLCVARSITFNHTIAIAEMAALAAVTKDAVIYAFKKMKDKIKKEQVIIGLNDEEMSQLQDAMALRAEVEAKAKEQKSREREEKRIREEQEKKELKKIRDRQIDMDIFLRKQSKKMPNRLQISTVGMIQWNLQNYDVDGKLNFKHSYKGKLLKPCKAPDGLPRRFPKHKIAMMPTKMENEKNEMTSEIPLKAEGTGRGRSRVEYMRMS